MSIGDDVEIGSAVVCHRFAVDVHRILLAARATHAHQRLIEHRVELLEVHVRGRVRDLGKYGVRSYHSDED